jgi:secreted PhoX family phosphatase
MRRLRLIFPVVFLLSCGGSETYEEKISVDDSTKVEVIDTLPPFESVESNFNTTDLILPEGFTYTVLFSEESDMVVREDGQQFPAKGKHDLSVFIPSEDDPENKGILYISHETSSAHQDLGDGGGATVFDIERVEGHWEVTSDFHHIDFSPVGFTDRNCGGSLAPNGNVLTCEETWGYDNEYFTKKRLG